MSTFTDFRTTILPYLRLIRPVQWSKSMFVLFGILYAKSWQTFPSVALAFLAFSFAASVVYILNDIYDRESDSQHPVKQYRPIANNMVSVQSAIGLLIGLWLISVWLAYAVSWSLLVIIVIYWLLNIAYNVKLKSIPILDVLIIASGFVLRTLAGTLGVGIDCSKRLLVSVTFVSLLIAFSKRFLEKQKGLSADIRPALSYYSNNLLLCLIILNAIFALISYFLYIYAVHRHSQPFYLTLVFAILGLARYLYVIFVANKFQSDDPIVLIMNDRGLLLFALGFVSVTLIALLGSHS